jgi:tetratricopeptide (TPR) repeat protein
LVAVLFVPLHAVAFEPGDKVVATRCFQFEQKTGRGDFCLPGTVLTVLKSDQREFQDKDMGRTGPTSHVVKQSEAADHFTRRLKRNPGDSDARCGLAIVISGTDKDEALRQIDDAVRQKESWMAWQCKAMVHRGRDERSAAESALARALELAPDQPELYLERGWMYLSAKDTENALAEFDKALKINPHSVRALYSRASSYGILKNYEQALTDFGAALAICPDAVDCLESRMAMLVILKKPYRALNDAEALLKLDPTDGSAYHTRGLILLNQGEFDGSLASLKEALRLMDSKSAKKRANIFMMRGTCYLQQEKVTEALADYSEAIRLDPDEASYYGNRAIIWLTKEDLSHAIDDCSKAIQLDPQSATWIANRGAAYFEAHDYSQAIADLTKALELNPTALRARCRLAMIYASCPDETLRSIKKAGEVIYGFKDQEKGADGPEDNKDRFLMVSTFGVLLAEMGDFKEAAKMAHMALAMAVDPKDEQVSRERIALYESGKPYRLPTKKR